ncbi:hypothetical protein ACFVFS_05520 [Kitasatospora sp. NPDC057692]|uniref:hypothetical protein n=1 Tax=Kitasatospora sp. NPDC057692 TaxID=3346215 RepID=UPI0036C41106
MEIGMRASTLRAALGQATGARVRVERTAPGIVRLIAAAPTEIDRWPEVLEVIQAGRTWGSMDATGEVRVWTEVEEP